MDSMNSSRDLHRNFIPWDPTKINKRTRHGSKRLVCLLVNNIQLKKINKLATQHTLFHLQHLETFF